MADEGNGGERDGRKRAAWAEYLSLSTLGLEMGATLAIGIAIGWFLDRRFKTGPWMLVIFTCFGIAAGFRNVVRIAKEQGREGRKTNDERRAKDDNRE